MFPVSICVQEILAATKSKMAYGSRRYSQRQTGRHFSGNLACFRFIFYPLYLYILIIIPS